MPPVTEERITPQGQAAKDRIAQARQMRNAGMATVDIRQNLQPTVSASALANPPAPVTVPEPVQPSIPSRLSQIVTNVTRDTDGFISAQTEEARQLRELQQTYGALSEEGSLSDLFRQTQEQYGVTPDSFRELKDIQLQLNDMDTASEVTKTRIGEGNSIAQADREITQEDRENAVRSAGLAARAAVLQGNISTATELATQAVNIAYQDRMLTATNLINQIDMLQTRVDEQTSQLLEQEKRTYEQELADIEELKTAVANAMVNGATQAEIAQLNNPNLPDDQKLQLAQTITARGQNEMRDLEIAEMNASINASNRSNRSDNLRPTSVIEQNGRKLLVDTQTGEVIKDFGETDLSVDELQQQQEIETINTIDSLKTDPGLNKAVGPNALGRWTPFKADVMTGDVSDFIASVDQLTKDLTLDNLIQRKGQGATFGALAIPELELIAESATKINNWRVQETDAAGNANTLYYDASENDFKKELDTISNFKKLNQILEGADPASIGVQVMDDGTYWVENSDGTYTQIR